MEKISLRLFPGEGFFRFHIFYSFTRKRPPVGDLFRQAKRSALGTPLFFVHILRCAWR